MTQYQLKPPSKQTLHKYGLNKEDWLKLLEECNYQCIICGREFGKIYGKSQKPLEAVIDHFHVKGFRRMKPEKRRRYVRGTVCRHCNHRCVGKWMNLKVAKNVVSYLEKYESTLPH